MKPETFLFILMGIPFAAFAILITITVIFPTVKRPAIIIFPDGITVSASHACVSNTSVTWESDIGNGTAGLTGVRVLWKEAGK